MKKIFNLTNKYIIVATPLIVFSLLTSVYLAVSMRNAKPISLVISLVLLFLMSAAFIAGFGKMLKSVVFEESENEPNAVIKSFPSGVGEYFLSSCGSIILICIINLLMLVAIYYTGMHFIGDAGISSEALSKSLSNTETLKIFLNSLSTEQLIKLNMWNLLIFAGISCTSLILLLYLPALFFSSKNPIFALWKSLKATFSKKFINILGIFLAIFSINAIISLLSAALASNTLTNLIMTLINFYFISYVAILLFKYYYENFEKPQVGINVDTYI